MQVLTSLYRIVIQASAVAAGVIIAAIAIAIAVDVALRSCCTSAIHGLTDMTEHGIAAATCLAAPWMVMMLPTRARLRLDLVMNLVGAAVSATFSWYLLQALTIAMQRGSMVRGIIVVPEWMTFAAPAASTLLLAIGFGLRIGTIPERRGATGL